MAKKIYTADELNKCDKETLAAIILALQDQVETLNQNMEKLIEQITAANNHRYGRKSEKIDVIDGQLDLLNIFNEPELLTECLYVPEPAEEDVIQPKAKKQKGKREADLKDLPVEIITHEFSEEELEDTFGDTGWKRLPFPEDTFRRASAGIPKGIQGCGSHGRVLCLSEDGQRKPGYHVCRMLCPLPQKIFRCLKRTERKAEGKCEDHSGIPGTPADCRHLPSG